MSVLYLIRHAQAGPRHKYDRLSDLGRIQAGLLGEHLASSKVKFAAVYSGELERQVETALAINQAYKVAGHPFPEISKDPRWNEFDLGDVYRAMANQLARDDPRFKQEYDHMMAVLEDENHEVHRRHNYCDTAVVRAWTEKRHPYDGESWEQFQSRILSPLDTLSRHESGEKIAVITSATPIGVWVGRVLETSERMMWRLAGVTFNAGVTTLRISGQESRLFTFNSVAHLPDGDLRSFR